MSENPFRRTDEIRTACLLSSKANNDGSGIGQSHLGSDLRPARQRRTLEMKKEENAAKEAFDGAPLAEFISGPGGRQAGAVFQVLGIERHNGDGPKHGMNPGNQ